MSSLKASPDLEKVAADKSNFLQTCSDVDIADGEVSSEKDINKQYWGILGKWSEKLESLGVEARGIQPVEPHERSPQSYWGLCLLW